MSLASSFLVLMWAFILYLIWSMSAPRPPIFLKSQKEAQLRNSLLWHSSWWVLTQRSASQTIVLIASYHFLSPPCSRTVIPGFSCESQSWRDFSSISFPDFERYSPYFMRASRSFHSLLIHLCLSSKRRNLNSVRIMQARYTGNRAAKIVIK